MKKILSLSCLLSFSIFGTSLQENPEHLFDKKFYADAYQVTEEEAYAHYQESDYKNRPNHWFDPSYHLEITSDSIQGDVLAIYAQQQSAKIEEAKTKSWDYVIAGAGFAGATSARKLAETGKSVLVVEKRPDVGGNAYDYFDAHGILIHLYGPHIFHTNDKEVLAFLSQFTNWRFYEHRVQSKVEGQLYPMPINRTTINKLYELSLQTDEECQVYLDSVKEPCGEVRNSEDVVLSLVGKDLCNKFFRNYTAKQWGGRDLKDLDASVLRRIPTRTNTDDRYFTDTYQLMPADGYTRMFRKMLDHPNITVLTNTDFNTLKSQLTYEHLVYTGPIDQYYRGIHGVLPYRSLRFKFEHLQGTEKYQTVGTVNYPNDELFTRITEFKHLTGQQHVGTTILKEYPQDANESDEPFYPVLSPENNDSLSAYQAQANLDNNVTFIGRLAEFKYYNMDQTVRVALDLTIKLLAE